MEIPKPIYASVDLGRDGKPLSNKPSSSSSSSSHDEKEGGGSRKKQQHNNKKSIKSSTLTDNSNNKKATRKPTKLWTPGDLLVSNTNNVVQDEEEEEEEEEENTENTHIKKSGKKSGKKPSSSITPRLIFKKEKDTDNWISSSSIENIKNSQKPASDLESDENDDHIDMFDENDDDIILISAKEKEESIHQRQEVKKREAANQAEVRELLKDMDEVDPVRRRLQDALKITASGRLKDTQEFKKKINSLNKIVEKQGKTISTLKQSLSLARKEIGYLTTLLDQANSQLQIYVPNESNNWGLNIPQQHHHQSQSVVPKRMALQQQQQQQQQQLWIKSKSEPVHELTPDIAAKSGTWIPGKGWSRPHQNSNNEKSMNDIPDGLMDSLMETLES